MKDITVKQAVDRLTEELRKDKSEGSYYHSWQANIAMAFKDEYDFDNRKFNAVCHTFDEIHNLSNNAARNFLDILTREIEE